MQCSAGASSRLIVAISDPRSRRQTNSKSIVWLARKPTLGTAQSSASQIMTNTPAVLLIFTLERGFGSTI